MCGATRKQASRKLHQLCLVSIETVYRADNVINICEMKYAKGRYLLDKDTQGALSEKAEVFRVVSRTRKAIHLTMVTSNGLVDNAYANQIQSKITLEELFAE